MDKPYKGLAQMHSAEAVTDHVLSSVWLAELFPGARLRIDGRRLEIDGTGF